MQHWARIAALALAVVALAAAPPVADAAPALADRPTVDERAVTAPGAAAQANNTTVRHRNPEDVEEDGDLDQVKAWLAARMGERLTESSIRLSEGEYELARQVVDEGYRRQLGKYVDVAGETDEEGDDRAGEAFERVRDDQEELATEVEAYRETREEYEAAKDAGEEERARELARELERIAADVNETSRSLADGYGTVSNVTGADLAAAERNVEAVAANVSEQQAAIRAAEFVATDLTATAGADRGSFVEPLTVSGRLRTANGTPLANRTVHLEVPGRRIAATTDADGAYAIEFRPTLVRAGNATLAMRFVPANASVYLGSTATANATVEQVRPTIDLSDHTGSAGFGDPVAASGTVVVDEVGAEGVPVVVEVGGVRLGTVETGSDGSFAFEGVLPADVPAGERQVRVRLPLEGRALAGANASAPLSVTETGVTMTLSAAAGEDRTIEVDGRLATVDGRAVDGQPVRIALDGSDATTVTTGADGSFSATVAVPPSLATGDGNATVVVAGRFDGAGTNLDSASATETVAVAAADGQGDPAGPGGSSVLGVPRWAWLALVVALLVAAGALYRYWGRSGAPQEDVAPTDAGGTADRAEAPDPGSTLLALARDRARGGRAEEAVEAGYGAVRRRLGAALDLASPRTHWEFYRACREAGLDADRLDALRRLTELYERAAFTPGPVSEEDADEAVGAADAIAGPERGGAPAPGGDD